MHTIDLSQKQGTLDRVSPMLKISKLASAFWNSDSAIGKILNLQTFLLSFANKSNDIVKELNKKK